MRLNQSKFAKEVGCSQQNISKLIKKGILEAGADKKLDFEYSLQKLRDYDLLDDNNKMKKSRTAKDDDIKTEETFSLPFDAPVAYKTLADLTLEEREQIEKEEIEAFNELEAKKQEAKAKNIDFNEDEFKKFIYAEAKAKREHFLAEVAEIEANIKKGELYSKLEVHNTIFEANRVIRDMILNLKSKLPARLIGQKDIKKIEEIINHECQYIITNLYRMEDLSK